MRRRVTMTTPQMQIALSRAWRWHTVCCCSAETSSGSHGSIHRTTAVAYDPDPVRGLDRRVRPDPPDPRQPARYPAAAGSAKGGGRKTEGSAPSPTCPRLDRRRYRSETLPRSARIAGSATANLLGLWATAIGMARASEPEEFFPKLTRRQPRINLHAAPSRDGGLICAEIAGAIPQHFRHLMNPKRLRN